MKELSNGSEVWVSKPKLNRVVQHNFIKSWHSLGKGGCQLNKALAQ